MGAFFISVINNVLKKFFHRRLLIKNFLIICVLLALFLNMTNLSNLLPVVMRFSNQKRNLKNIPIKN